MNIKTIDPRGKVIAIINPQSGVGTTTIATHLAQGFSELGYSTALIDFTRTEDAQRQLQTLLPQTSLPERYIDSWEGMDDHDGDEFRPWLGGFCWTDFRTSVLNELDYYAWDGAGVSRGLLLMDNVSLCCNSARTEYDVTIIDTPSTGMLHFPIACTADFVIHSVSSHRAAMNRGSLEQCARLHQLTHRLYRDSPGEAGVIAIDCDANRVPRPGSFREQYLAVCGDLEFPALNADSVIPFADEARNATAQGHTAFSDDARPELVEAWWTTVKRVQKRVKLPQTDAGTHDARQLDGHNGHCDDFDNIEDYIF